MFHAYYEGILLSEHFNIGGAMGMLIITRKFELGMLNETLVKTTGLAMSSPDMDDARRLYQEYMQRPEHSVFFEMDSDNTYQGDHERYYYARALERLTNTKTFHPLNKFAFNSFTFKEDDHLMVIKCSHDPIFSSPEFKEENTKIYLFSF